MFTSLVATLVVSLSSNGLSCPVMGSAVTTDKPAMDYNGARYHFCCAGCDTAFAKEPVKTLKADKIKGKVVGYSLFDPVSGKRITEQKAKGSAEHEGLRYYFESEANKSAFEKSPKQYTNAPKMESLTCPVMSQVTTQDKAFAYVDHNGTRYYVCCEACYPILKQDPSKFAALAKPATPKAVAAKK